MIDKQTNRKSDREVIRNNRRSRKSFFVIKPKELKSASQRDICTPRHTATASITSNE